MKQILLAAAVCACASALGDFTWNIQDGGALDNPGNWTPRGMPGAADAVTLRYEQSAPYFLENSDLSVRAINVQNDADLDLGAGKSFLAAGDSSNSKIILWPDVTLRLLSGTFGVGDTGNRFFLGERGDNEKVVVSGANSILRSSLTSPVIVGQGKKNCSLLVKDGGTFHGCLSLGVSNAGSTGHTAVFTGAGTRFVSDSSHYSDGSWDKASAVIGLMGSYNELAISNNAEMVVGDGRSVTMGAKYGSYPTGGNNLFKVTHGGRVAVDYLYAGRNGSSNTVLVCAGGDLAVSNRLYVGYRPDAATYVLCDNTVRVTGEGSRLFAGVNGIYVADKTCTNGLLEVADGGRVECVGRVRVGASESNSNTVRVAAGGRFDLRDAVLDVGGDATSGAENSVFEVVGGVFTCTNTAAKNYINIVGNGGRFSLLDGAVASLSNTFVQVGAQNSPSTNALFEMRGGSRLEQVQPSTIDHRYFTRGVGSRFVVDASTIDTPGLFLCTGQASENSVSNRLEIVNGAVVNLRRIVVGDNGAYCSLDLDDSTLSLSNLGLGYTGGDSIDLHTTLRVRGANSKITIVNEFMPRNDTALEFTIPAEGFLNQPVITCKEIETAKMTSPSLVVKRDAHHIDGGRIVLIKANNTDIDMETLRAKLAVTLPEGCALDLSNPREIAVRVPSRRGTRIFLK